MQLSLAFHQILWHWRHFSQRTSAARFRPPHPSLSQTSQGHNWAIVMSLMLSLGCINMFFWSRLLDGCGKQMQNDANRMQTECKHMQTQKNNSEFYNLILRRYCSTYIKYRGMLLQWVQEWQACNSLHPLEPNGFEYKYWMNQ